MKTKKNDEDEMFFILKMREGLPADVCLGWDLIGYSPLELPITVKDAIHNFTPFVYSLHTKGIDTAFELVAQSSAPGGVGPSLSLRARVSHQDGATALAAARSVAKGLAAGLALMKRFQWVPINETRYKQLFEGSSPACIWEISQRSQLVELKAENRTPASGRYGLAIYPYVPQPDPVGRIMRILNQCEEPMRVTIALAPAKFTTRELDFLDAQQKAASKDSDEEDDVLLSPYRSLSLLSTTARAEFMKDGAYLLRVYAASPGPVPEFTVNSLAIALAAPAAPSEYAGGFNVQLLAGEEKTVAETNLENLRFTLPAFQTSTAWGRLPLLVSAPEAAALFRFPTSLCPGLKRIPNSAPYMGLAETEGTVIGHAASSSAAHAEVRLSSEARLRHVVIDGQTGTGKTSLMLSMALQDARNGHGLCILAPHGDDKGDLYSLFRENLPVSRRKDLILCNCSMPKPDFCFNFLEHTSAGEPVRIAESLRDIVGQIYDLRNTGGPIFDMGFVSSLLLVMCDPLAKLENVMQFYYDKTYRSYCASLCRDPFVVSAWERIVATAGGEMSLANLAPYVVSKLSPFLFNERIRSIVSCQKSSLNFNNILQTRKIVVVNLAKGSIGPLASSFIGMLFTEKILRAAMDPKNKTKKAGTNFYLYADEAQTIVTPGFAELLSEARKYKLGAVLATQFLGQLPSSVLSAVLGNVGNLLCMRVGPADAGLLESYFQSAFSKADLLSLPIGTATASILSKGEKSSPFLLSTSNGMALAEANAAKQEEREADVKPETYTKRTVRRPRGGLRQAKPDSKGDTSGINTP